MKPVIILLSFIFAVYSQPNDTARYKFDVVLDSAINNAHINKEIKAVKAVDSSTECDKEAVAAEITRYQQQLHSLQQATYELACNELTHYKQSAFNNSMALVSIGAGIAASIVAVSNVRHEKAYKTPTIEITLGVGVIAGGLSRFIHQW